MELYKDDQGDDIYCYSIRVPKYDHWTHCATRPRFVYFPSNVAKSLQWRRGASKHLNLFIYFASCSGNHQWIHSRAPHYWHIVNGIHLPPMDSPQKGPVMWKVCPCHYFIMRNEEPKQVGKILWRLPVIEAWHLHPRYGILCNGGC